MSAATDKQIAILRAFGVELEPTDRDVLRDCPAGVCPGCGKRRTMCFSEHAACANDPGPSSGELAAMCLWVDDEETATALLEMAAGNGAQA